MNVYTQEQFDKITKDFDGLIHIYGNIQKIDRAFNNTAIRLYENALVDEVTGDVVIWAMYGNSQINILAGSAKVCYCVDDSQILSVEENAKIGCCGNNAKIYIKKTAWLANNINTIKFYEKSTCEIISDMKKQEKKPYFADAKVGDKVKCIMNGDGVVGRLEYGAYPLIIRFIDTTFAAYTLDGCYYIGVNQTLFYADNYPLIISS